MQSMNQVDKNFFTKDSIPTRDFLSQIDDAMRLSTDSSEPVWIEKPIDIDTFVEDAAFCGHPPLTDIQREGAYQILGDNPLESFSGDDEITVVVMLLGKGSGKDTWAVLMQLYICYWLNCMQNPHSYLNLVEGDPIDIVNVSRVGENAERVYFNRFKARLTRCMWFMDNFDISENGRRMTGKRTETKGRLYITGTKVQFPDMNLNCYSENSSHEKYEGYNTLMWTMDEASAFYSDRNRRIANAPKVYSTLRSSATTRFGNRWKGCILSWPRHEERVDFTLQKYKESLTDPTMIGFKEVAWRAGPKGRYKGETFVFEYAAPDGSKIVFDDVPVEFRNEADKEPLTFLRKYCCISLRGEDMLFDEFGLRKSFTARTPIFQTQQIIVEHMKDGEPLFRGVGKKIVQWDVSEWDKKIPHVIHVDLGKSGCNAALLVAHGEPMTVESATYDEEGNPTDEVEEVEINKIVEDAHIIWTPQRNLPVSIVNVEDIIRDIAGTIRVSIAQYDQWNSASALEALAAAGIRTVEHTITTSDYVDLERLIRIGAVDLLDIPEIEGGEPLLQAELSGLRDLDGRVLKTESKDLADCLAGVARVLNGERSLSRLLSSDVLKPRQTQGFGTARALASITLPFSGAELPLANTPNAPRVMGSTTGGSPSVRAVSIGRQHDRPTQRQAPIPIHHL